MADSFSCPHWPALFTTTGSPTEIRRQSDANSQKGGGLVVVDGNPGRVPIPPALWLRRFARGQSPPPPTRSLARSSFCFGAADEQGGLARFDKDTHEIAIFGPSTGTFIALS